MSTKEELLEALAVGELDDAQDAELAQAMADPAFAREALDVYRVGSLLRARQARPLSKLTVEAIVDRGLKARKALKGTRILRRLLEGFGAVAVLAAVAGIIWFATPITDNQENNTGGESRPAPDFIDDEHVRLAFDHSRGAITMLVWKPGFDQNIIDSYWNKKLGGSLTNIKESVNDVGVYNEYLAAETTLDSWSREGSTARFAYSNPRYGKKTLTLNWSKERFTMTVDFTPSKQGKFVIGGHMERWPTHGSALVNGQETKFDIAYRGNSSTIFLGNATALYAADKEGKIAYGWKTERLQEMQLSSGMALDGPFTYFTEHGSAVFEVGQEEPVRYRFGMAK